ncbi:hypothetical protein D3C78_19860 [compost metagenome]
MNVKQVKEMVPEIINVLSVETLDMYSVLDDESETREILHESETLVDKRIIVETDTEEYYLGYIETCCDPNEQDSYERRLILAGIGDQIYNSDDVKTIKVKSNEAYVVPDAKLVLINGTLPYYFERKEDKIALEQIKISSGEYISFEVMQSSNEDLTIISILWDINGTVQRKPIEVLSCVISQGDAYLNPVNKHLPNTAQFAEHPDAYWGKNLFYIPNETAYMRADGIWIKIDHKWLETGILLPTSIAEEWNMLKMIK